MEICTKGFIINNLNHPNPIEFIPLSVDTTGRMYDEFIRLLFFHTHRETSVSVNELPEESDQFLFLLTSCFSNLKGAVGFSLASPFRASFVHVVPHRF